jgi:hypothetical protein
MINGMPWHYRLLRYAFPSALLLLIVACDVEPAIVYTDPSVDLGDYTGGFVVEGDPEVYLGFYVEQLFAPLEDGGECPIAWGLQGGTWTMPAIQTRGIGSPAIIHCTLVAASGELLGDVASESPLYLTPELYLEIQAYPVPVTHEPPNETEPIEDLYGQTATLTCSVMGPREELGETSVQVELVEG